MELEWIRGVLGLGSVSELGCWNLEGAVVGTHGGVGCREMEARHLYNKKTNEI